MDQELAEFETWLKQFQPRKPGDLAAYPSLAYLPARWGWAAAIVLLACGAVVLQWRSPQPVAPQPTTPALVFRGTPPPAPTVTVGALSRLLDRPEQLDAVLTEASRRLLPHVDRPDNALHLLAKE